MRIQNLVVKGFRSLADVAWDPGDLNILIGPNASGKSNLLRVLEMLSDSARGGLEKYVQHEGGMEPLVWDGSAERIEIEISQTQEDQAGGIFVRRYELELARLGKSSGYRIGRELLVVDGPEEPFKMLERTPLRAVVLDTDNATKGEFVAPEGSVSDVETFLSV